MDIGEALLPIGRIALCKECVRHLMTVPNAETTARIKERLQGFAFAYLRAFHSGKSLLETRNNNVGRKGYVGG